MQTTTSTVVGPLLARLPYRSGMISHSQAQEIQRLLQELRHEMSLTQSDLVGGYSGRSCRRRGQSPGAAGLEQRQEASRERLRG